MLGLTHVVKLIRDECSRLQVDVPDAIRPRGRTDIQDRDEICL